MKVRAKFSLREVDRGFDALQKALDDAHHKRSYVQVGVIGEKGNAPSSADGLTNAQLAAVHEFGVPERGIPERSFIRAPYAKNRPVYIRQLRGLMVKVYEGKITIERALNLMGARISNDFRLNITTGTGVAPANAASTVRAKGSARPLVDTGRLVNSLSWSVVIPGKNE